MQLGTELGAVLMQLFPTIPDEFWEKVGVQKKKKGAEKRKRAVKKEV